MKKNGEKNEEKNEETKKVIFNLADSLGKNKKDILDIFECSGAKSEEELLHQAENEEKVKDSVSKLKEILESHTKFNGMTVPEGLKEKEWKEISLIAGGFGVVLSIASLFVSLFSKSKMPISRKMFRNAIRSNIPIALFDEELQKKVDDLLKLDSKNVDPDYKSLVSEVIGKILKELGQSKPTNGLVYFEEKSGGFIYREIDKDSDKIYCRIPIKSFGNKDLQYSIGKVDAYIVYEKGQDGIWKGSLVMDDYYDFPEGNFKGKGIKGKVKGFLNKSGHYFQEKGKIMPYHWRISVEMPDITEKDIKIDYSAVA